MELLLGCRRTTLFCFYRWEPIYRSGNGRKKQGDRCSRCSFSVSSTRGEDTRRRRRAWTDSHRGRSFRGSTRRPSRCWCVPWWSLRISWVKTIQHILLHALNSPGLIQWEVCIIPVCATHPSKSLKSHLEGEIGVHIAICKSTSQNLHNKMSCCTITSRLPCLFYNTEVLHFHYEMAPMSSKGPPSRLLLTLNLTEGDPCHFHTHTIHRLASYLLEGTILNRLE
jgi:hypothetical protein